MMKVKLLDVISCNNDIPSNEISKSTSVVLQFWTNYGMYETAINKMTLNYLQKTGNTQSCQKALYFQAKVGDIVSYKISFKNVDNVNSYVVLVEDALKIPDLFDNEKYAFHTTMKSTNILYLQMKCIQGIYHHIQPELLPPIEDKSSKKMIVDLFLHSASFIPNIVNLSKNCSTIEIITNEHPTIYDINRRTYGYASNTPYSLAFDPFRIEAEIGNGCEINCYQSIDGDETKRTKLATCHFGWPNFFDKTDIHIQSVTWIQNGMPSWGCIILQRPRLLTDHYKSLFSTDDNDLNGLIRDGHNFCAQLDSCSIQ